MSKSLGNFKTVRDIIAEYDPQVIRFFMLQAHYRGPLNFSDEPIESAKNGLERILTAAEKLRDIIAKGNPDGDGDAAFIGELPKFTEKFEAAMEDDLNTADAITAVFDLVRYTNTECNEDTSKAAASAAYELLEKLTGVLGIKLDKAEDSLDKEVEALIEERQAARKAKDFAKADEIRDKLLSMGIELKDTREGVKWKRI
jgi:cysteinyl-tRNA synthetase